VTTRTIALGDLATEIRKDEVRTLARDAGRALRALRESVRCRRHQATRSRLDGRAHRELLNTEQYKAMDRVAVQRALLGLLSTQKAQVEDIVKDASSRDQALDAYDTFVHKKMEDRAVARERQDRRDEGPDPRPRKAVHPAGGGIPGRPGSPPRVARAEGRDGRGNGHSLSFLLDHPVVSVTRLEPKK